MLLHLIIKRGEAGSPVLQEGGEGGGGDGRLKEESKRLGAAGVDFLVSTVVHLAPRSVARASTFLNMFWIAHLCSRMMCDMLMLSHVV